MVSSKKKRNMKENNTQTSSLRRKKKHQGQATGRRHICPCSEPNPVAPTFCWVERMHTHTDIYPCIPSGLWGDFMFPLCGRWQAPRMRRKTTLISDYIPIFFSFLFLVQFSCVVCLMCILRWGEFKETGGFAFFESGALVIYTTVVGGALVLGFFPFPEGQTDRVFLTHL